MEYTIVMAQEDDKNGILSLYKAQIGRKYCPWDEGYPSAETIDTDLSRNTLFVMKSGEKIISAISIEEDADVDALPFWSRDIEPTGELARLAVTPDEQSKGIGRIMLRFGMAELKRRGFQGIRFLVEKHNKKAISCYADFDFRVVGECHMYEQDFLCYEKEL